MNIRIASTQPAVAQGAAEASSPPAARAIEARRKRPAGPGEPERVSAGSLEMLSEPLRRALQANAEEGDGRNGARQGT